MSEAALKKIENECERLNDELTKLSEAVPTKDACKTLINYVEKQEDPFLAEYKETNPWTSGSPNPGPCCVIM